MSRRPAPPPPIPMCGDRRVVRTPYIAQCFPDRPEMGQVLRCTRPPGHDGWHGDETQFIGWTDNPDTAGAPGTEPRHV